jgi:hypothetical protein
VAKGGERDSDVDALVRPGRSLHLDTSDQAGRGPDIRWTVPHALKQARAVKGPNGIADSEVLMTPAALSGRMAGVLTGSVYLKVDETVPDVHEYVRNTAARIDPLADAMVWASTERSQKFTSIRTGTSVGAVCVLVLIGLSLLVSQLEQLRERRKLLSSLVAFGTRRRTLSLSVLWQTTVPIALGLLLAAAVGLTLGTVLLKMAGASVGVDWPSLLSMTGAGAAVVLAVTLLSLPPLVRMMRPEGLRTE